MRPSSGKRVLLTGPPGCGKTTVARKVAALLRDGVSGFYTEEARDNRGQRVGFGVTSLDGKRGELAHKGPGSGPRVGSYLVNVKEFERIALPSLSTEAGGVVIIDEIGKMECCSKQFVLRVEQLFESEIAILATIPSQGGGALIESIRRRGDVETVIVTRQNREALPGQIAKKLSLPATGETP